MALHEALDKGADEALMMDVNGFISEGSGENIFFIKDNVVFTPTINHCLNGITRQSVLKIAKDLNYETIEKDLKYSELVSSDEAFFTGTAVEITPISKVDQNIIGSGSRGKVTYELQKIFDQTVSGNNSLYKDWLTYTN